MRKKQTNKQTKEGSKDRWGGMEGNEDRDRDRMVNRVGREGRGGEGGEGKDVKMVQKHKSENL